MARQNKIIYGNLSKTPMEKLDWGEKGKLFQNWGKLKIDGFLITFTKQVDYKEWCDSGRENLCIVEEGKGKAIFKGKEYSLEQGTVFKVFPDQKPEIISDKELKIFSVQMPTSRTRFPDEDLSILSVKKSKEILDMVYEYEALGQEFFTPNYENGLGLIRFTFPINNIPLHIHPNADRIIRPLAGVSGKGFTFADPDRYEMNQDAFCMFPAGTKHTNGPLPGEVYDLWAVQLPWIPSKITEENIAGDEKFVQYVQTVPPKALWKTKEGLREAVRKLKK